MRWELLPDWDHLREGDAQAFFTLWETKLFTTKPCDSAEAFSSPFLLLRIDAPDPSSLPDMNKSC